ncbi:MULTISPECIES: muconolactone Delta-isomerase [Micrococcaceae]|jgi:muconolactone D-isomerase|uniref:muconolactone Delta-isomerase n=1 Tax=Micrococcaceae TaxID=1268 RepID=UPI000CFB2691|nr:MULTISPECIES: muconolactone Delta-isomerase [Micrococcaceae]PRB69234.1 muconolactone delta-isomerase [Arthrobacter sp. MYb213]HAY42744.1 muconolactone delta-isomerase [Micrococcaceae bacterium]HJX77451.1 muconolactone Delta-isomerase [Glutamicibacter sp.]
MLFLARMDVSFPAHLTTEQVADFQVREKAYSAQLQESGKMQGIWRIVGEYANHSIYDVESNDELHQILSGFPMYAYMKIKVTPLAKHPNSIR